MRKRIPFQISGLLALNGVSILGNAITEIAIPWLILEIMAVVVLGGLAVYRMMRGRDK
ncbi:hypothetical protein [Xenorhabdus beddingii]|uniref:hypothetical protein n=1 Tax=Xenorhabdus beddingii TaxID=40578 RepID=UPI001428D0FD|nr:hypothetical protein [Xenorhabdus beddingii]